MTNQVMTNDELCARLSAKYRNRIDAACTNAKNITEDISRRKEQANAKKRKKSGMVGESRPRTVKQIPGFTSAKMAAYEPSFENFVADGNYTYAKAKAAGIREWATSCAQYGYGAQQTERTSSRLSNTTIEKKTHKAKARLSFASMISGVFENEESEANETRVKAVPISKSFIVSVVLCTVMLMVVLFTYSSYTQLSTNVEDLKEEQAQLMAEREHLKGLVAVRDDIREIEDYATNVIGMVKSDYVETRHVSVADGERIEVISVEGAEEDAGDVFSTLLSAMGGNWERVLEYID